MTKGQLKREYKINKSFAECPNCKKRFPANNNQDVDCPYCEFSFVFCLDEHLSKWD